MPAPVPGRYFLVSSGRQVLEADPESFDRNGSRIQVARRINTLNQVWTVVDAGGGWHSLLSLASGKALDAHDREVDQAGGRLQLWQHHSRNRNQMWELLELEENRFALRCAASQGTKVLQIKGNLERAGTEVELGDFRASNMQIWSFVPAPNAAVVTDQSVDLRPNQTPVKSQGGRGACTYFGTTAALEAAYKKQGYGDIDLSEEFWSIMGKALWLHPTWSDIQHANYTENQFAGTQGGGSSKFYRHGLRIPLESDVPYRPVDYVPPNWATRVQREVNDYNFSHFTNNVLRAPLYYGVRTVVEVPVQGQNGARYERLLRLGYEIVIDLRTIYGGAHNVILVGYDRSNPRQPVFYVKNSHGPAGADPRETFDTFSYERLLPDIASAFYLQEPLDPAPWEELAFLGRWNLFFDGHQAMLDIYHIPGVSLLTEYTPEIPDRRIGVLFGSNGQAHRVNGSMRGRRIVFHFDGAVPNLRYDEIRGRRFTYYLDPEAGIMTGFHDDGGGPIYAGVAFRDAAPGFARPRASGFASLSESRWNVHFGDRRGVARFNMAGAKSVRGVFRQTDGSERKIEAALQDDGRIVFWLEGTSGAGLGRILNHAPGLIAGHTTSNLAFYLSHMG